MRVRASELPYSVADRVDPLPERVAGAGVLERVAQLFAGVERLEAFEGRGDGGRRRRERRGHGRERERTGLGRRFDLVELLP